MQSTTPKDKNTDQPTNPSTNLHTPFILTFTKISVLDRSYRSITNPSICQRCIPYLSKFVFFTSFCLSIASCHSSTNPLSMPSSKQLFLTHPINSKMTYPLNCKQQLCFSATLDFPASITSKNCLNCNIKQNWQ